MFVLHARIMSPSQRRQHREASCHWCQTPSLDEDVQKDATLQQPGLKAAAAFLLFFLKQGDRRRHEQWEGPGKWTHKWRNGQTWRTRQTVQVRWRTWQVDRQVKGWTDVNKAKDLTSGQTSERLYRRDQSKGLDKQTNKWRTGQLWTKQRTWQVDRQTKDRTDVKKQRTWQVDWQAKDWTDMNKAKDLTSGQTSEGLDRGGLTKQCSGQRQWT